MIKKTKNLLNETDGNVKALSNSMLMSNYLPKQKKKNGAGYKMQKFIERKKREELIKKSLEATIEVEKQQKIH